MRKAIFGLGFFLLIACSGQSLSDESNSGAAAASGEEANGGGSGDTDHGGTSSGASSGSGGVATGGSGGASPTGGVPAGGAATGGATASGGDGTGEAGEAGEATGGTAGLATGGGAGQSAGTGGRSPTDAECDPADGELEATPYPDCEPRDLTDACELCIQAECCAESKICYGYEPGNVCGWGGPTDGVYAGLNEIDCYVACVRDYVSENGAYDDGADSECVPTCTTASCGLIGNATQDLVVCMRTHCEDDCFWP